MTADRLEPPDFTRILKSDAVHLISPVLLQETSEADHALSRTADVRKCDVYKVFLTDPADSFLFSVLRRLIFYKRVCAEHAGVRCDRLCRCHSHVLLINAAGRPDPLSFDRIRDCRKFHRVARKLDLHMGKD